MSDRKRASSLARIVLGNLISRSSEQRSKEKKRINVKIMNKTYKILPGSADNRYPAYPNDSTEKSSLRRVVFVC